VQTTPSLYDGPVCSLARYALRATCWRVLADLADGRARGWLGCGGDRVVWATPLPLRHGCWSAAGRGHARHRRAMHRRHRAAVPYLRT
jgi:hypothetical protein